MTDSGKGVTALVSASALWGLSPLYYNLLDDVPTVEVLAHRALWSLIFFAVVLGWQRRLGEVLALFASWRRLAVVTLAATMIMTNWSLFIWSVQTGRTVESSLGYFIFPLVTVLLGVLFHREGLGGAKALAVSLAGLAVLVLTLGLGVAPWVSLVLATTFGIYGLVKKSVAAGPVVSVTGEVLIFAPFALIFVALAEWSGGIGAIVPASGTFGHDLSDSLLLILAGPVTAAPLVLFSYGARRVSMATSGLVQYVNPSLQFAIATLIFTEPFTRWHAIAFPMIWVALAIYSGRTLAQDRSARRAAIRAGTSSTALK